MILLLLACSTHELEAAPPGATVTPEVDFGPHEDAQTEWWHVHARLRDSATGEPLDLFVGFVTQRTDLDRVGPIPVPLAANPFHAAYVRLASPERAWSADRQSFPDLFSAGFRQGGPFHGDWSLREEEGALLLSASAGPVQTDLRLIQTRAPSLPGASGRVQLAPLATSMWEQEEGLSVQGRWTEGREVRYVEGAAFFKHQWGRLYHPDVEGFEWFSADLPDGDALSIGWIQSGGEAGVPGSLAWLAAPDGAITPLDPSKIHIERLSHWESPRSGASWPVEWSISGEGLDLRVEAERQDQEIWAFPAAIWAGPARFVGEVGGREVALIGFAEQVGAHAPRLRSLFRSDTPPGEVAPPPPPPPEEEAPSPFLFIGGPEIEEAL